MNYPDYRLRQEQEMYEYYKSIDYSKVTDWSVLFSTHSDYVNALVKMAHPFHKEAMIIRENRKYLRPERGSDTPSWRMKNNDSVISPNPFG